MIVLIKGQLCLQFKYIWTIICLFDSNYNIFIIIIINLLLFPAFNRHCGVDKPTWKEIRHFVWFLNVQLSACEQSNFLPKWKGLKSFVANFMIKMSKVCFDYFYMIIHK